MRATQLKEMFYAITTDNSNQKVNKDRSNGANVSIDIDNVYLCLLIR